MAAAEQLSGIGSTEPARESNADSFAKTCRDRIEGPPWAWQLLERLAAGFCAAVGADCQNRALHRLQQQGLSCVQLDCDRRGDPSEAAAALSTDFCDATAGLGL